MIHFEKGKAGPLKSMAYKWTICAFFKQFFSWYFASIFPPFIVVVIHFEMYKSVNVILLNAGKTA